MDGAAAAGAGAGAGGGVGRDQVKCLFFPLLAVLAVLQWKKTTTNKWVLVAYEGWRFLKQQWPRDAGDE